MTHAVQVVWIVHLNWLITKYDLIKKILEDPNTFSSSSSSSSQKIPSKMEVASPP